MKEKKKAYFINQKFFIRGCTQCKPTINQMQHKLKKLQIYDSIQGSTTKCNTFQIPYFLLFAANPVS